jgi:hypothetical protein
MFQEPTRMPVAALPARGHGQIEGEALGWRIGRRRSTPGLVQRVAFRQIRCGGTAERRDPLTTGAVEDFGATGGLRLRIELVVEDVTAGMGERREKEGTT